MVLPQVGSIWYALLPMYRKYEKKLATANENIQNISQEFKNIGTQFWNIGREFVAIGGEIKNIITKMVVDEEEKQNPDVWPDRDVQAWAWVSSDSSVSSWPLVSNDSSVSLPSQPVSLDAGSVSSWVFMQEQSPEGVQEQHLVPPSHTAMIGDQPIVNDIQR